MSAPPSAAGTIRARFAAERVRCVSLHRSGQGGGAVVRAWCRAVDRAVRDLAGIYLAGGSGITLLACGGYGRGELAFASDVDLLLLISRRVPDEAVVAFLRSLWDLGLDLGHQVLDLPAALELAAGDTATLTSFLEARTLWGEVDPAAVFETRLRREVLTPRRAEYEAGKVAEFTARHTRAGDTVYLAEPDVKESPGGLRDIHTLLWLSHARGGPRRWREYLAQQAPGRREYASLLQARDLSLYVRNALHLHRERKWDRLDHRSQEELARRSGTEGQGGRLPVETFMQEYYRAVWTIFTFTRLQLAAQGYAVDSLSGRLPGLLAPEGAGGRRWAPGELAGDPLAVLERFLDLTRRRDRLCPETAEYLFRNGETLGRAAARQPGHGPLVMLLLEETGAAGTLRLMHELGVLGGLLKEFARLRALVQFDPYHSYTVDEHTLRALEALEVLLARGEGGGWANGDDLPAVCGLLPLAQWQPDRRDAALLRLAILYHDIAKGTGSGGHAERGARMVREAGRRLGLTEAERRDTAFLVRHHLLLAGTAQRRDISETILINRLRRLIRTPRRLHLLALLTLADLAALGPHVLTRWKSRLLTELVAAVERAMQGEDVLRREERIGLILAGIAPDEREAAGIFLGAMPPEYLPDLDPETLRLEQDLFEAWRAAGAGGEAVTVRLDHGRETSRLTCLARDRPGLLGRICGLLAAHDITILQARIFTRLDAAIVDRFTVADAVGGGTITTEQESAVTAQLEAAVTGRTDIEAMLAAHTERWRLRDRPKMTYSVTVAWDPGASERYTVIDVRARDQVGLLHDVAVTMTGLGVSIHQAFVSTEGERAVDAFYVTDPLGAPLDPATRDLLIAELRTVLTR